MVLIYHYSLNGAKMQYLLFMKVLHMKVLDKILKLILFSFNYLTSSSFTSSSIKLTPEVFE